MSPGLPFDCLHLQVPAGEVGLFLPLVESYALGLVVGMALLGGIGGFGCGRGSGGGVG